MLTVLAGVDTGQHAAVVGGAVLVVSVTSAGAVRLIRLVRRRLAGRLQPTVCFYVAAAGFLAAGATSGTLLGTGHAGGGQQSAYPVPFHAHVNLFGWVGLSVLGTLFMLWPAALGTRMPAVAPTAARRTLLGCVAGLLFAAIGLLAHQPVWAAAGMLTYAGGVGFSLDPFLRATWRRRPHNVAAASLAAALGWLFAATLWDAAAIAGTPHVDTIADQLAPMLALALVAQVLVGALSFLLPVLLGGGPAGGKRAAEILGLHWPIRLTLTNLGILLTVLPLPSSWHTVGYAVALTGLGCFLPLAVAGFIATTSAPNRGLDEAHADT